MKRLMSVALAAAFSVAVLAACNTVKGVGKDIQKAGEKIEDVSGK